MLLKPLRFILTLCINAVSSSVFCVYFSFFFFFCLCLSIFLLFVLKLERSVLNNFSHALCFTVCSLYFVLQ